MTIEEKLVVLGDAFARIESLRFNAYEADRGNIHLYTAERIEQELHKIVMLIKQLDDALRLEVVDDFADLDGLEDIESV